MLKARWTVPVTHRFSSFFDFLDGFTLSLMRFPGERCRITKIYEAHLDLLRYGTGAFHRRAGWVGF
jgi:hypothetical protein